MEPPPPRAEPFEPDYQLLVEAATDYALFFLDPQGVIRTWNRGAQNIKGYAAHEIIGRHFSVFYPVQEIQRGWPAHELAEALRVGRFEDEGWRLRKDGTRFWANIVITRLLDASGHLHGFSKMTRDLTERRHQETLLRQSEERFRLLVEGVKDYAIFMLDPGGHIVSWNPGAQAIKGYDAPEVIGRHLSIFYPAELAAAGRPEVLLRKALDDGRVEDEGWRLRRDGSRFWAGITITALYDDHGLHRGFAKVTRDLTDRRRIRALEDEGRRITTFLAMLGHELRNPLAPIVHALKVIELNNPSGEMLAPCGVIERQIGQLTRLVDDLLDVGRITSGKIHLEAKAFRLVDAVLEAMEAAAPFAEERGHRSSVSVEDPDLWIRGDRTRIVQVIGNLLHNAAKFTDCGGLIHVAVRRNAGNAEVSVRDNGCGIPAARLQDIFNLFVQGEQDSAREHGGLGLGLSLVQQLVAMHGGDVAAFSSGPGRGSEFMVRLPSTPPRIEAARPAILAPHPTDRRILVVDDNRDAADTLVLLLSTMGYDASVAYDGPSALAATRQRTPSLVMLDLGLPGMSGIDVGRQILADSGGTIVVVALSGYGQASDRQATHEAGFRAHFAKPLEMTQMLRLFDEVFGGGNASA